MANTRLVFGEGVPLWWDEERQTIRVTGTRLKLEAIVRLQGGHSPLMPRTVASEFDVVTIRMAEGILEWCRRHPDELDVYMRQVGSEEASVLSQVVSRKEGGLKRQSERWNQRAHAQPV